MQDKTILITGGNAGIGRATAEALAEKGATVVLACRNLEKGQIAQDQIRKNTGNEQVDLLHLDLADLENVRDAAETFQKRYDRLDVLVNNAGIFTSDLQRTAQSFEKQFGVNHLGHFLLTQLLLEPLRKASAPRVVNVSSNAHYQGKIDWDSLQGDIRDYSSWSAYAQSKLANVLFTREFARRYPDVVSNALHPGVIATEFGNKETPWYLSLIWSVMKLGMRSPAKGAKTSIYLAAAPEAGNFTGEYLNDKQEVRKGSPLSRDMSLAERLWAYSEEVVAGYAG